MTWPSIARGNNSGRTISTRVRIGMSPRHAKSVQTILVVDDDSSVVTVVHSILAVYGYEVLEARSVEEAIGAVKANLSGIDLLVIDAVMPRMSGPELADILLFLCPDMKVLFITGLDGLAIRLAFDRPCQCLQKPFSPLFLVSKVQESLGSAHSGGPLTTDHPSSLRTGGF